MAYETRLFINNEFVEGSGQLFGVTNPTNGSRISEVHGASDSDVDRAVSAAEAAFPEWGSRSAAERAGPMFKLVELIQRDMDELAALDAICMGKPIELLKRMDLPACAGVFRYFAGSAHHILGETSLAANNFVNMTVRQPFGVVGLIIPWNVPLIMFAFKVAPALICGNTCVLKSSEKAPLSSLKMAALIKEAGFPPGAVNVINGPGDPTGAALSLHMRIRKISFTGSVATGKKILIAAAESNLKKVSLELGGKSPAIIFEDADIQAAAKYGQHCQASSRVIIHESKVDEYLNYIKQLADEVTRGDPFSKAVFQGPQVDKQQADRIRKLVDIGIKDGTLVLGADIQGNFIDFTVLRDVPTTSLAYQEEIFGPVLIVNTFKTEEEALREANVTVASVYTKDFERALRISLALESGAVGVNCSVPLRALDMPIGGWKQSGIGRELSLHGLNEFTQLKTVFLKYGEDRTTLASKWHNQLAVNGA